MNYGGNVIAVLREFAELHELGTTDNGEAQYDKDMPGMTLEEFQRWTDELIKEVE